MYHAYKSGYSLLPQLKKINKKHIFQLSPERDRFLNQKQISIKSQKCFLEHNMTNEIYKDVCGFIIENYPIPVYGEFPDLCMQIQEDIAIHRISDTTDWLAATHICYPSGWSPEEKIGKTFNEIHAPIPGMNLSNSRKLVETMVNHGPFERYVWGLVYENELNYHPNIVRNKFNLLNPVIFAKIERQITYGFPEHNAVLFILKQYLIPEQDIDKELILKALLSMTPKQRVYKGISDDVINYLGG